MILSIVAPLVLTAPAAAQPRAAVSIPRAAAAALPLAASAAPSSASPVRSERVELSPRRPGGREPISPELRAIDRELSEASRRRVLASADVSSTRLRGMLAGWKSGRGYLETPGTRVGFVFDGSQLPPGAEPPRLGQEMEFELLRHRAEPPAVGKVVPLRLNGVVGPLSVVKPDDGSPEAAFEGRHAPGQRVSFELVNDPAAGRWAINLSAGDPAVAPRDLVEEANALPSRHPWKAAWSEGARRMLAALSPADRVDAVRSLSGDALDERLAAARFLAGTPYRVAQVGRAPYGVVFERLPGSVLVIVHAVAPFRLYGGFRRVKAEVERASGGRVRL